MPEVIFNGSDGRLEGRYVHGEGPTPPLAMILHPHPLHGGTMNNRIVYSLFHMFARRGFSVLRFNFRGVGRSQGVFDHGQGELRDAAAALDWMQQHNPNSTGCWVAGFSFGAWIAMQLLMRRPEIVGFMCASLPANMYDFTFLAPCPASGLIVHGERDTVSPPEVGGEAGQQALAAARHHDRLQLPRARRPLFHRPPRGARRDLRGLSRQAPEAGRAADGPGALSGASGPS